MSNRVFDRTTVVFLGLLLAAAILVPVLNALGKPITHPGLHRNRREESHAEWIAAREKRRCQRCDQQVQ